MHNIVQELKPSLPATHRSQRQIFCLQPVFYILSAASD